MSDGAQIFDQGYRHYDGPRLPASHAMTTVVRHSLERVLGIRRTIWQKVVPAGVIAMAYIPAIVFVGLAALLDQDLITDEILPSYAEYYGFITAAIVIFVAFVAPELTCTDQRSGMLGLYLSSPLNRDRYLAAKAAAVGLILSIVTVGPVLLLFVSYTLESEGPDGPVGFVTTLVRILVAGLAISAMHTALSLAVSTSTDRRSVAAATIVVVLLVSGIAANALVESGVSEYLNLFNLAGLPIQTVFRVWGERSESASFRAVPTAAIVAANVAWTLIFAAIARINVHRWRVTR